MEGHMNFARRSITAFRREIVPGFVKPRHFEFLMSCIQEFSLIKCSDVSMDFPIKIPRVQSFSLFEWQNVGEHLSDRIEVAVGYPLAWVSWMSAVACVSWQVCGKDVLGCHVVDIGYVWLKSKVELVCKVDCWLSHNVIQSAWKDPHGFVFKISRVGYESLWWIQLCFVYHCRKT